MEVFMDALGDTKQTWQQRNSQVHEGFSSSPLPHQQPLRRSHTPSIRRC